MIHGYARVSTDAQDLTSHFARLTAVTRFFARGSVRVYM